MPTSQPPRVSVIIPTFNRGSLVRGAIDSVLGQSFRDFELIVIDDGMVAERLLFANWIQSSTVLVRAHCLKEVGGFDEEVGNFGEDWLAWMRVASRYPIYFLPQPLVLYRVHEETLTSHQPEAQY